MNVLVAALIHYSHQYAGAAAQERVNFSTSAAEERLNFSTLSCNNCKPRGARLLEGNSFTCETDTHNTNLQDRSLKAITCLGQNRLRR